MNTFDWKNHQSGGGPYTWHHVNSADGTTSDTTFEAGGGGNAGGTAGGNGAGKNGRPPFGGRRDTHRGRRGGSGVPKFAWIAAAALVVLWLAGSCFYKVSEQEQAVLMAFGKVQDVKSAGLYFKIPLVQRVIKVDTTTKGMPIGYRIDGAQYDNYTVEHEAVMITKDYNFVDVDFYVEYRVVDPRAYLFASSSPEEILANIAQAAIRSTVVNFDVDDVITTGKSQIQSEVRERIDEALEENSIGIKVVNLTVQDAEPPTEDVLAAFKAVETAKQGSETSVNNARRYESEKIPEAEAEADRILQEAEAAKEARIAEANGQVARFAQMYAEYSKNPAITKRRLLYEALEDVLPGAKVIIDKGDTQKILPLDGFASSQEGVAVTAGTMTEGE